jgi:death-on-curing protein
MSPNVSERDKDRITFKNLIKSLHEEFESLEPSDSKEILIKKLEELELELSWFDYSGKSIIIYIDKVETSVYILHSVEQPFSIVSQTFHIIPLVLYYQNLKTYLVLALQADDFKILKGNRYEMKPIELLEKTSLKDTFSDSEHQKYVTHGSYGGTKEESIFHGHGITKDLKDIIKMKYFKYIDDYIIEHSGGLKGSKDLNLLRSTLEFVKNDDYYPEFEDKVSYLFYSINKNHAFNDGNKRSSIALSAYFLEINGLGYIVSKFIKLMENIAVDVADNLIDRELLKEIITSIIYDEDFSYELKLKIIDAKTKNEQ